MFGRPGRAAALSLIAAPLVLAGAPPSHLVSGCGPDSPGLRWEVLAGIGTIESDDGRSHARRAQRQEPQGAEGPMQVEPATFREYAVRDLRL